MAATAHRASHRCASRNSRRLPQGGRDRSTSTGRLGATRAGKTGQRGDHRLWPTDFTSNEPSGSGHQCLRAIPRTARAGTRSWSECHGHLAGPGFRSRLSPRLPDREAFCFASFAVLHNPKPWGLFTPQREKKHRPITDRARWYAMRRAENIAARACS
jgi:hypothetical protein